MLTREIELSQECQYWNIPGCPVVKNLLSTAGDAGSIPGWGTKIWPALGKLSPTREAHVLPLLSLCWATREAWAWKALVLQLREAPAHFSKDAVKRRKEKTGTFSMDVKFRRHLKSLVILPHNFLCQHQDECYPPLYRLENQRWWWLNITHLAGSCAGISMWMPQFPAMELFSLTIPNCFYINTWFYI